MWLDIVLFFDDVGSNWVELVGRLVEFVEWLYYVVGGFSGVWLLVVWLDVLVMGIDLLIVCNDGW